MEFRKGFRGFLEGFRGYVSESVPGQFKWVQVGCQRRNRGSQEDFIGITIGFREFHSVSGGFGGVPGRFQEYFRGIQEV